MKQLFNPLCCCGYANERCLVKGPLSDTKLSEILNRDFRNGGVIPIIGYRLSGNNYDYSIIESEGYSVGGPFTSLGVYGQYQYKSGMIVEVQYGTTGSVTSAGFFEVNPSTGKVNDPDNNFPFGAMSYPPNINLVSFNIILRKYREEIDASQSNDIDKYYDLVSCQYRTCAEGEDGYFSGWKTKEEILDLLSGNNFNGEPGIQVYLHSFRREWVDNGSV